ncbi:hypothetical protein ACQKLN_20805 [Paenibacillus glucanolyticus]|uniref:hypothetical protein n=1 Tax=Paenibacillus glucanolyticus TaxID=59843 RepID=UPI00367D5A4F
MKSKKTFGYLAILLFSLFIIIWVLSGLTQPGREAEDLRMSIEWLTKYVLPWIFLYWFVKLVRKIK